MANNRNWGIEKVNNTAINIVFFVSRNKDNKQIEGFKERHMAFLTHEAMDSEKLQRKFQNFVAEGVVGETSRMYYSINSRNAEKIHTAFLHFLIDNPDFNLCSVDPQLAGIAANKENAADKKWLFDFDINDEAKVKEFAEDIKAIDAAIEVTYRKTPNGYAVVTSRGFDTRKLYEKWDRDLTECKRDASMCIAWATKA